MSSPVLYFIDTCIPIYAAGREHMYKDPCALLLTAIAGGEVEAATDSPTPPSAHATRSTSQ